MLNTSICEYDELLESSLLAHSTPHRHTTNAQIMHEMIICSIFPLPVALPFQYKSKEITKEKKNY